ncbi:MAG: F0F1 ATP synthase subunit alpha, partial [Gammaproteobacteria bacterium]
MTDTTALQKILCETDGLIEKAMNDNPARLKGRETGRLFRMSGGIAEVQGLPGAGSMELLRFEGGVMGMAFNLDPDEVGVVLLGSGAGLKAGSEVRRTGEVVGVPVGEGLLGRVIDGLGKPLDGGGPIQAVGHWAVEREAPAIIDRDPVSVPLQTGIKVIDTLIPIGRGQRQLILGDRQIGKTAIAVDAMLNQRGKNVVCVYCSIGQRG